MKYTILGFSQRRAVELGLDLKHLMVLRWFVDFKDSGNMTIKMFEDDKYYWVKYDGLIQALPILKTTNEDTVYRYLKKLSKVGVLKHRTLKQNGVWSFYTIGDLYKELIDDSYVFGNKSEAVGNKSEGNGNKSEGNGKISEGNGKKSGTNNSSINNTSINNTISTTQSEEKLPVVNTNKELIEKETHLKLNSFNKQNKIKNWDKDRLIKAIEIFKSKEGKYFSLLEKIYNDDGNYIKKGASKIDTPSHNISIYQTKENIPQVKTRFHNINQSFMNYEADELEKMLFENQKKKFGGN